MQVQWVVSLTATTHITYVSGITRVLEHPYINNRFILDGC